jgi:hypothetical protein
MESLLDGALSRTAWNVSGGLPPRYQLKAPPSRTEREKGGAPAYTLRPWHSRFLPFRKERERMGHPHHVCDLELRVLSLGRPPGGIPLIGVRLVLLGRHYF